MGEKLGPVGITFDDVLAGAPLYERRAGRGRRQHPAHPTHPAQYPAAQLADGHRHRVGHGHRPGPGGGLGVIHKNMSIERQTEEVDKVKRSANGIITDPVTLPPDATVARAREVMDQHNVSGVPITTAGRQLAGIITRRDLRFLETGDLKISEVMTRENLVTATGTVTLAEAERILMAKKVEKLLLVDENNTLTGLITIKDIDMMKRFPNACKDGKGRLRVGAAIGVHDYERAESLLAKDVDVLVVDSAHGHSANVIETVRNIETALGYRRRRRQRRHGRRLPRPDRRRGRRGESRHRARARSARPA